MKTSELKRLLRLHGCYLIGHGKRHDQWFSPISGKTFVIPRHDSQEIPTGTEKNIRRAAGI